MFGRLCSRLSWKSSPDRPKKRPTRSFNIGAKVVNITEVDAQGQPIGNVRFVRDARYDSSEGKWLYQLQKDQKWVVEEALRRAPKGESDPSRKRT